MVVGEAILQWGWLVVGGPVVLCGLGVLEEIEFVFPPIHTSLVWMDVI